MNTDDIHMRMLDITVTLNRDKKNRDKVKLTVLDRSEYIAELVRLYDLLPDSDWEYVTGSVSQLNSLMNAHGK